MSTKTKRLGFFTRLLSDTGPGERLVLAAEQIRTAEDLGYDTAWVAQHHFHRAEGGLPAPLVFLAHVAATTRRIRLGTAIITLPLESPLRVAEDAAILDLLSGGRLELGLGTGGTPGSYTAFGLDHAARSGLYDAGCATLRRAFLGAELGGGNRLYPEAGGLAGRIWQATFSAAGGARAGQAGDGLLLARSQPRSPESPLAPLDELQLPIIEAYLGALPAGTAPRIMASRSVFVADDRDTARSLADTGLRRSLAALPGRERASADAGLDELIRLHDCHVGTPDEVTASLALDRVLDHATEIAVQVHSVDPPHALTLRSLELFARQVAPAAGWR